MKDPITVHPFIWPKATKDNSLFATRLGRMLHWLGIIVFCLCVAIILGQANEQRREQGDADRLIAAWHALNPPPVVLPNGNVEYTFHFSDGTSETYGGPPGSTREQAAYYAAQTHPYESYTQPDPFTWNYDPMIWAAIIGFTSILAGRGMRYLFAGE